MAGSKSLVDNGRHPNTLVVSRRVGTSSARVRQVFGYGPFRVDSSVCKAAFFSGVIGEDGGVATLTFGGREGAYNVLQC